MYSDSIALILNTICSQNNVYIRNNVCIKTKDIYYIYLNTFSHFGFIKINTWQNKKRIWYHYLANYSIFVLEISNIY